MTRKKEKRLQNAFSPEMAEKDMVGGTSPFATRRDMPVYIEESILPLPRICINGGKPGYLIGIEPQVCVQLLNAKPVNCALIE